MVQGKPNHPFLTAGHALHRTWLGRSEDFVHREDPQVRKYEFAYILDPGLDDHAVAESMARYVKLIQDQGGEVTQQDLWGRRKLAYEINKKTDGVYVYIRMRGTRKVVDELHRTLRFDESVMRNLIVLDEDAERRNAEARAHLGPNADLDRIDRPERERDRDRDHDRGDRAEVRMGG
jgi:small subunit ribosomal protein S6